MVKGAKVVKGAKCGAWGRVAGSVTPQGACRAGPLPGRSERRSVRPDRRADGPARSRAWLLVWGGCLSVFVFVCVVCLCLCLCVLCVVCACACVFCACVCACVCGACCTACVFMCVCVVGRCCVCACVCECMWSKRGPDPCSQTFTGQK